MGKKGNGFVDRTGQSRVMRNGHTAIIVGYRNAHDIDVKFPELGVVREHMHYNSFKDGTISPWEHLKGENHMGETMTMKCGLTATIVSYRRCDNVDVLFENGELVTSVEYRRFAKGNIDPNAQKNRNHVGEHKIMNCGQECVVVCYRKYNDIDVEFPALGITKTNVSYGNFVSGNISPQKKKDVTNHIGETRHQKTRNMDATIIAWRTKKDIDVLFVDNKKKEHTNYKSFKRGTVCLDGQDRKKMLLDAKRREFIGKKNVMNCGLECEIIEYNGCYDISVRFSDGVVVKERTYDSFVNKSIGHPTVKASVAIDVKKKSERIGSRKQMNSGLWATVITYNKATDMSVQFDDGAIVNSVSWNRFVTGSIAHPSKARVLDGASRINEEHMANNGMMMKIVAYKSASDVDVEFEDGVVVQSVNYHDVKLGRVSHPTKRTIETMSLQEFAICFYLRKFGFCKIEQGEWENRGFGRYELDFYNESANVAIEYDGAIHEMEKIVKRDLDKNIKCKKLGVKLYRLRDPILPILNDGNSINYVLSKERRITDRLTDCTAELKEILQQCNIAINDDDIDFTRDANIIINEYKETYIDFYEKKHVGEVSYSNRAQMAMKIIAYYDSHHVDVEFADGERRTGITYNSFVGGRVEHPSKLFDNVAEKRLGEVRVMNNGLEAKIICYRKSKDIDVEFVEDGKRRYHMTYYCFERGKIRHPDTLFGDTSAYKKTAS